MNKRTKRIGVICAHTSNNAGMYSVDLAASHFLKKHGYNYDLLDAHTQPVRGSRYLWKFNFRFWQSRRNFGEHSYRRFKNIKQFDQYSHIIYWGDFLNNPIYGATNFSKSDIVHGFSRSMIDAFERWKKLFIPKIDQTKVHVGSFGGNFLHDFGEKESESRHLLKEILNTFDIIAPRDIVSKRNLDDITNEVSAKKVLKQGIDCAFLQNESVDSSPKNQFCYFFGRSGFPETESLVTNLSKHLNLSSVNLNEWLSLKPESAAVKFAELKNVISSSQFVLTDTYHVSVNSMNSGVPVFCLGNKQKKQFGTLGDYKKECLFNMFGGQDFYLSKLETEDFNLFYSNAFTLICNSYPHLQSKFSSVLSNISKYRESMKTELLDFLKKN